ncbi:MAG: hypothetical protein A2086_10730 [Spirochaetes bacterium GWD1_27_9]|nr:MAG: hypothetical protein A2Y34_01265 [Spirochaetes bacterium GWC1_27_15]OHD35177.1 MAG: hypothetical protein A2086_10730 [Spirochaetes bacterium GWD1_27_9]
MRNNNNDPKFFNNFFSNKNNIFYKVIILALLFTVIFLFIILQPIGKIIIPSIGKVLEEDIFADRDLKYFDENATKENQEVIKSTTPPVYIFNKEISEKRYEEIKLLFDKIKISKDFYEISKDFRHIGLKMEEYNFLKKEMWLDSNFSDRFLEILLKLSNLGIVDFGSKDNTSLETSGLIIAFYENNNLVEILYSLEDVYNKTKIKEKSKEIIENSFSNYDFIKKNMILSILNKSIVENVIYNKEISEVRLNSRLKNNSYVYRKIKQGQVIARKGDIVTEEVTLKIKAINASKEKTVNFKSIAATALFLIAILIFSYFFIKIYDNMFFKDLKNIIFVSVILLTYVMYLSLPIYFGMDKTSIYFGLFVPISTISLTFVFLYSQVISCFFSIILSIFFFVISGFNFSSFIFIFFSGISAVFTISTVKRRVDLLISGILISLINVFIALLVILYTNKEIKYFDFILIALSNGIVSSILAIGFIALGELILNSPTIFRLQELSDASSDLMKELFDSAVGTYNHSILVANLSEAAANEIGANGFLAKVGGCYHDIGKIDNPEYFIENQGEYNIHTQIKPSISATVIKSHIRKGAERAKASKLPQKVIDIITQHHGNSLIKYFYNQALKFNDDLKEEIKEDSFRYNEQKPQFPEAAIVMLADQVEAAARVLKKPSMSSVEKLIEGIIDEKFQEGVLDDSGLTLKDLTKIKKVFVKLIVGMYHSRIVYQERKEEQDKEKENLTQQ